jgi:hypothetical protein
LNCADIAINVDNAMAYYDTNGDLEVNGGDDIDAENLALIVEYCD